MLRIEQTGSEDVDYPRCLTVADITQQFFQTVASGTRFQEAFNLLNGMDLFGMLRALNALDAPMLR